MSFTDYIVERAILDGSFSMGPGSRTRCKYCGSRTVEWEHHWRDGYRLLDVFTGLVHSCRRDPDADFGDLTP